MSYCNRPSLEKIKSYVKEDAPKVEKELVKELREMSYAGYLEISNALKASYQLLKPANDLVMYGHFLDYRAVLILGNTLHVVIVTGETGHILYATSEKNIGAEVEIKWTPHPLIEIPYGLFNNQFKEREKLNRLYQY